MNHENPVKLMRHEPWWLLKSRVEYKIQSQKARGNSMFFLLHYYYLMTRN